MTAVAEEQDQSKKERLFSDISVAQVLATALAAVTSMLLSSYIGIAGSVIGVAVASVVSTLAASAYKKFLRDSAEKIKELPLPVALPGSAKGAGAANAGSDGDESEGEGVDDGEKRNAAATEDAPASPEQNGPHSKEPANEDVPTPGDATAPDKKRLVRGLVAVCVVSALLAVAASGAVVYLLTTGEGLGTKPAPIYLNAPRSSEPQTDRPEDASGSTSASGSDNSSAPSSSTSSSASSSSMSSSSASSSSASSSSSGSASSSGSSSASSSTSGSSSTEPSSDGAAGESDTTTSSPASASSSSLA